MLLQHYRLSATLKKDEHEEYIATCSEWEDFFVTGKSPEETIHRLAGDIDRICARVLWMISIYITIRLTGKIISLAYSKFCYNNPLKISPL